MAIYMPMVLELVVAMLACARIGAVHSIVFGGYSADSLASRILDGQTKALVTADGVYRGKKLIPLLEIAHHAIESAAKQGQTVEVNLVVRHLTRLHSASASTNEVSLSSWSKDRDFWWHEEMKSASPDCKSLSLSNYSLS